MIIRDALLEGLDFLRSVGNEAPAIEAGVLLCHVLKCHKTFIYAHDDYKLSEIEYQKYWELILKRAQGKPLQYIMEHQEFMGLNFKVTPEVLIPRQDTEILVESILDYASDLKDDSIDILDIGTGSGCISVSLAYYLKNSKVKALDINLKSLEIAKFNAQKNSVLNRIDFICGDIFTGLKNILTSGENNNLFDVIVSNPPYIASHEIDILEKQVREFEPSIALDGGMDGLDFYRAISKEGALFLKEQGLLAFEVGIYQAEEVCSIMEERYKDLKIIKDLSGIDRVIMGTVRK
ncbi:UNVERIFIED_CONTAM: release factor glutamine methyltransferase [Acetivibrio alkalicellulosi]